MRGIVIERLGANTGDRKIIEQNLSRKAHRLRIVVDIYEEGPGNEVRFYEL